VVTGLGPRYPRHVFHLDAWYNGKGEAHPGIVLMDPAEGARAGSGSLGFGVGAGDAASGDRRLAGQRTLVREPLLAVERRFTIHQNTCYAAATFGWLCGPAKAAGTKR